MPLGSPALKLILTCEHAGNRVPGPYRALFRERDELLASHRGWDPGALPLARRLARDLDAPLRYSLTTRLLIDPNRSHANPTLFSEITAPLPEGERARILRRYYRRHRGGVERLLQTEIQRGTPVVHLGVHTFSPVWEGHPRDVDIGVLYDPARPRERRLARRWERAIARSLPYLRVRSNAPYRGTDDGFTTELRERLPPERYMGLELEVTQQISGAAPRERSPIFRALSTTLREALRSSDTDGP